MKRLLIIIVAVVSLAVSSPSYTHPNDVKYGGISFRFDNALANDVKSETVPASLFGKPRDIWPGKGVFFLTRWDTETSQITKDGLEYAFQGITSDGKYYVYAEFSVSAPGLANGDEPAVIAWNKKEYLLTRQSPKYQTYIRGVVTQLEALRGDEFQPKLELFERLISSLHVQSQ